MKKIKDNEKFKEVIGIKEKNRKYEYSRTHVLALSRLVIKHIMNYSCKINWELSFLVK